jgi:hypothetical protein
LLTAKNYTALAAPPAAAPPAAISARTHVMKVMRRHILRLVGIAAVTIAIPQLASVFDSATSAALKLAMGPVSAPQRRSVAPTTPSQRARHLRSRARSRITARNAGAPAPPPGRGDRDAELADDAEFILGHALRDPRAHPPFL